MTMLLDNRIPQGLVKANAAARRSAVNANRDRDGSLICLCVYRKGAQEVLRRLQAMEKEGA